MSEPIKLLIVDDSRLIRHSISDIISNYFSIDVLTIHHAEDGDTALQIIESIKPEIVLLDITMKRVNGIDVLKAVKPQTASGHIIVLMISGIDDDETLSICFKLGAKDFIRKPIHDVELVSRLEGALHNHALIKNLHALNQDLLNAKNNMVQSEKMAAIGHLAAGVAHEINNPIGFISSNISTLQSYFRLWQSGDIERFRNIEDDIPELFSDLNIGIVRIKEIIDSLRSFSRIDNTNSIEPFDIEQGIKDTLIVARHRYRYIAEVRTNFSQIPRILCNGGKINQVLMNLIINAADAISMAQTVDQRDGLIQISTFTDYESNKIIIQIVDNGIGMDETMIQSIFNPFFTTKPVGSGTGLGLSVSYDIITNEHDGSITCQSTPNLGTTFTITLPIKT